MNAKMTKVTALITVEVILGKMRLNPHAGEPSYLNRLRHLLLQLKKLLGDNFPGFVEELRPTIHVLADLLFDAVTETKSDGTIEKLRALPVPQRLTIERIVNEATGKDIHNRWNDELWNLRKKLRYMTETSISGLTLSDIREGYDSLVHEIVDELWNRRDVLVN